MKYIFIDEGALLAQKHAKYFDAFEIFNFWARVYTGHEGFQAFIRSSHASRLYTRWQLENTYEVFKEWASNHSFENANEYGLRSFLCEKI